MTKHLASETIWYDKFKYDDAERIYQEKLARGEDPRVASSTAPSGKKDKSKKDSPKSEQVEQSSKQGSTSGSKGKHGAKNPQVSKEPPKSPQVTKEPPKSPQVTKEPPKSPRVTKEPQKSPQVSKEPQEAKKQKTKAENQKEQTLSQSSSSSQTQSSSTLISEIVRAREHIKLSLESGESVGEDMLANKFQKLELENENLRKTVFDLKALVCKLETRVSALEQNKPTSGAVQAKPTPAKAPEKKPAADDDDIDLFGSDDDEEADALRKKRVDEYAAKKAKKPGPIAKSSVVLDVKPWDDETDMKVVEEQVRTIVMDGLLWGASKLVPLAFGIKKLQIVTVIEDEKVSVEELTEKIEALEDLVQSVDIAAFNKI